MPVSDGIADHTKLLDALVHGYIGIDVFTQVQFHAVVVFMVGLLVQVFQRLVAQSHSPLQTFP